MSSILFAAQDKLLAAIEEYAVRHKGFLPEKIFVSEEMYSVLAHESSSLILHQDEIPHSRFFGIPVVRYGSTGTAEFYLSDKEAI